MTNKKELNQEELESVNGGGCYKNVDSINWLFGKNAPVKVQLSDNTTLIDAKVTKKGFTYLWYFMDLYYVESTSNSSVNGWYAGNDFSGNVVNITKKSKLVITELSW